jgi:hypothetical protein
MGGQLDFGRSSLPFQCLDVSKTEFAHPNGPEQAMLLISKALSRTQSSKTNIYFFSDFIINN